MHSERASTTALLVAALRALASTGSAPLLSDPYAGRFLPRPLAKAIELSSRRRRTAALLRLVPDAISPGRLQHIALRTRVIDDAVASEMTRGIGQLVLLGAGFDTRAFRLGALTGARVLEVDHPATQRRKLARSRGLVPRAREHHLVPVDFERDDLEAQLRAGPFVASEPCVVVWEGVLMYLSLEAIEATLGALSSLMAAGSLLIASYYDVSGASGPPSRVTTRLAALVGERFVTCLAAPEAAFLVTRFGFAPEADSGRNDWALTHGRAPRGSAQERVILARRGRSERD